jgi:hypothetical protein
MILFVISALCGVGGGVLVRVAFSIIRQRIGE